MMKTLTDSNANQTQIVHVERVLHELLREVLHQDVHGTASIELAISNGTIQRIARSVQRVEKIDRKQSGEAA